MKYPSRISQTTLRRPGIYSLFHQILGVAFFQFSRSLFKIFEQIFSRKFFSSFPDILENLVKFIYVLSISDHMTCNKISNDSSHFTISVKQDLYNMLNGLT